MRPTKPPAKHLMLLEAFSGLELLRLGANLPRLQNQPRGDGRLISVLPGLGATDRSTAPLRRYLSHLNYKPVGWDLGRNNGKLAAVLPLMIARTALQVETQGAPVDIIGWSMGGVIARAIAKERPDLVNQIITMGSPVVGGPKYTFAAGYYRKQGMDLDQIEDYIDERNKVPLTRPCTAIYSKSDGVVHWKACLDPVNDHVDHIEVKTTHMGLGYNPDVFEIVAQKLAAG